MTQAQAHHAPKASHTVNTVLVAMGGGLGTLARYGVVSSTGFLSLDPRWAEVIVNITGSFLMGIIIGWFALYGRGGARLQLFLATGILGGYTTFSGYSLDSVTLMEQGNYPLAAAYITGSVALALSGLFTGLWIMRRLANGKGP